MIDLLFRAKKAERHPVEMMFIGFFYTSISILLSLWILPDYASLVMVFFTVVSCLYIVQKAIIIDETAEDRIESEKTLLAYHAKTLRFLLFLFLGFVAAFVLWTIILPYNSLNLLFNLQSSAVSGIGGLTGNAVFNQGFSQIIANNVKVVILSFLFALFYGSGAIFILVWNASIMGFVIGDLARNTFGMIALPAIIAKYFIHGIPEMAAYSCATLAGGILFISIVRGDIIYKPFKITSGIVVLMLLSLLLVVVSALIEVYITPII